MTCGNCKSINQVQLQIKGIYIERVYEMKLLGVIIDDKICWKSHIKHIQTKLSRSISVLAKAKHILDYREKHSANNNLGLNNL